MDGRRFLTLFITLAITLVKMKATTSSSSPSAGTEQTTFASTTTQKGPNCTANWKLSSVSNNNVTFQKNNTHDKHNNFKYYAIYLPEGVGLINPSPMCSCETGYSTLRKDIDTFSISGLASGSPYSVSFKTAMDKGNCTCALTSDMCPPFHWYTVPELPVIHIPMEHIGTDRFTVTIDTNSNVHFNEWRVDVYNDTQCITNITQLSNETSVMISDKIFPSKEYNVTVTTIAGGQTNTSADTPVFTRPITSNPGYVSKTTRSSITLSFVYDVNVKNFTEFIVKVFNNSVRFDGPCQDASDVCNISRSTKTLTLSNLQSGSLYLVDVYTSFHGLENKLPQRISKYTVPELPAILIDAETISTDRFTVTIDKNSSVHFKEWRVDVYNHTHYITNSTQSSTDTSLVISDGIFPSKEYNVTVTTIVDGQTNTSANTSVFTRPNNSNPGYVSKSTSRSITLSFVYDVYVKNFTEFIVKVFNNSVRFDGPCQDASDVCNFSRSTSQLTLSNLQSGSLYLVDVYTSFHGLENKLPQRISKYTVPELPAILIDAETISTDRFTVTIDKNSSVHFKEWRVDVYNHTHYITNSTQSSTDTSLVISDGIFPSKEYNVTVTTIVDGQTNTSANTSVFTRPNNSNPGYVSKSTSRSITLSFVYDVYVKNFTEFIVKVFNNSVRFDGPCQDASDVCNFSRSTSQLTLSNLQSGSLYLVDVYTSFHGLENKLPQRISKYTVPELPAILIDAETISTDRFTVTIDKNSSVHFKEWRVDVYNHTHYITNSTQSSTNTSLVISDGIFSSKEYNVTVTTIVDGQTNTSANMSVFTRPNNSNPGYVSKSTSSSITLSFVYDDNVKNFTEFIVKVFNKSVSFDGPCQDASDVCNFSRSTKTLTLSNLQSGSLYLVDVYTSFHGLKNKLPQHIFKYTVPSTPTNVMISEEFIFETNITVQFNVPDDRFDYAEIMVCESEQINCSSTNTSYNTEKSVVISNLHGGTNYSISVATVMNDLLKSQPSALKFIDTAPLPAEVEYNESTVNTITLDLSHNDGIVFAGYLIRYVRLSALNINHRNTMAEITDNSALSIYVPKENTSALLWDLQPGSRYRITIFTVLNSIYSTRFKQLCVYTRPERISLDSVQITSYTNSSLNVSWSPGHAGQVDGYNVIFYCQSPNYKLSMSKNNSYLTPSAEIIELDPGTFCNITIEPYIVNGEYGHLNGELFSKELKESTKEEAPGEVTNMTSFNITSKSAVLQWSQPTIRNGIIRQYIILVKLEDITIATALMTCTDCKTSEGGLYNNSSILYNTTDSYSKHQATFSSEFKNLHPYTNYTYMISAFTEVQGPDFTAAFQTDEDIPGVPMILTNIDTSNNSIKMQWLLAPEERNGIVKNYTIMYTYFERECRGNGAIRTIFKIATNEEIVLNESIYAYWHYNISVRATNVKGTGNYSNVHTVQTKESDPGIIKEINSTFVFARNATIRWLDPCLSNGVLEHFYVEIRNDTERDNKPAWISTAMVNATSHTSHELLIHDLLPFRNYSVRIHAENTYFNGTNSISHGFLTTIDDPETPTELRLTQNKSSSIMVSWDKVKQYTGPTMYIVRATDQRTNQLVFISNTTVGWWFDELETKAVITGLDAYWNYTVTVTALTSSGNMDMRYSATSKINVRTAEDIPGPVTNLSVRSETDLDRPRQLFVAWTPPTERDLNGIIIGYGIMCSNRDQPINTADHSYTIPLLIDDTLNITVQVWAVTSVGNGNSTEHVIPVSPGEPPFVRSLDEYNDLKTSYYKTWYQVKDDDKMQPYIATSELKPKCNTEHNTRRRRSVEEDTINFIVGSDDCSNNKGFCNGPLQPGRSYRVKSFACTTTGCTETVYSYPIQTAPNLVPAIVGGLAAAVVVIAVLAAIVYTKRTRKLCFSGKAIETEQNGGDIEIPEVKTPPTEYIFKPGPVRLSEFSEYVDRMHTDSKLLFSDAFKMLRDKSPAHPITAADSQQCRPKNRYTNIMPFDHSRVKLRALDDVEGSDFINANFIPGYNSRREYIATQGPMQMTFDDFWRMVWEQNVDTIVMLTKLAEKGRIKCDQYWPKANEPVFYGEVVVSIKSESNLPDYILRIFEIKTSKGPSRIVKQFWYLKWPDMGCPEDPQMLLDFVKSVREHTHRPGRTNPTVVHCSAGVGRTGTFIAVDHLLQHIRHHDDVNIFQLVMDMREHRVNMVQTEDQFIYIYECLKAFISVDEEDEEPVYQNGDFGAENVYENAGFRQ